MGAGRLISSLGPQLRSFSLEAASSVPTNFYPGFEGMPQLQQLRISCSDMMPTIRAFPPSWGSFNSWPALRSMSIRGCGASGDLSWVDMPGVLPLVTSLDLSRNALNGSLPAGETTSSM
jgi:hypothetical protein